MLVAYPCFLSVAHFYGNKIVSPHVHAYLHDQGIYQNLQVIAVNVHSVNLYCYIFYPGQIYPGHDVIRPEV